MALTRTCLAVARIVSMSSPLWQLPQPGFPWVSPTAGGGYFSNT